MEIALITWWTSGIWKEISSYLLRKNTFCIVTWSRNYYKTRKNEVYIQFDQNTDSKIVEKLGKITYNLKYVFLNVGVFYPDDSSEEDLDYMEKINYESNLAILKNLHEKGFLKKTNIIVNASIQAKFPRILTTKYAETKKKLTESVLEYAKQEDIALCVIWPSMIRLETKMFKNFMKYYISKWIYKDEKSFRKNIIMTELSILIKKINDIYFGSNYERFKHKFIAIWKTPESIK